MWEKGLLEEIGVGNILLEVSRTPAKPLCFGDARTQGLHF